MSAATIQQQPETVTKRNSAFHAGLEKLRDSNVQPHTFRSAQALSDGSVTTSARGGDAGMYAGMYKT